MEVILSVLGFLDLPDEHEVFASALSKADRLISCFKHNVPSRLCLSSPFLAILGHRALAGCLALGAPGRHPENFHRLAVISSGRVLTFCQLGITFRTLRWMVSGCNLKTGVAVSTAASSGRTAMRTSPGQRGSLWALPLPGRPGRWRGGRRAAFSLVLAGIQRIRSVPGCQESDGILSAPEPLGDPFAHVG